MDWEKIKPVLWGAVGGAIVLAIVEGILHRVGPAQGIDLGKEKCGIGAV